MLIIFLVESSLSRGKINSKTGELVYCKCLTLSMLGKNSADNILIEVKVIGNRYTFMGGNSVKKSLPSEKGLFYKERTGLQGSQIIFVLSFLGRLFTEGSFFSINII